MTSPFSVEIDGRIIRVLRPGERGPAGPPGPPGPPGMGSGSYSNSNPQPLGATPAPGVTDEASRADHVHPLPSAADIGLGNVNNTTDLGKPISTATQTALDGKAAATHSHATGDITGFGAAAAAAAPVQSVAGKTGVVALVKADVGLGNVDNTTDLGKPISTATQTALDGKAAATHSHTAGADGSVQYKSGTVFAGATNVAISSGDLSLATSSSPTTPLAGTIKTIVKPLTSGGSPRLLAKVPNGAELDLLSSMLNYRFGFAGFGSTSAYNAGLRGMNITGTMAGQNMASGAGKIRTQTTSTVTSAATAGSFAGLHSSPPEFYISDGSGAGGFLCDTRFGVSDTVSAARMCVGLSVSTGIPANVAPSTLTNLIGVGHDAGETTYSLYYGGTTAQTPISLGTDFPVNTTDLMQFIVASYPGVSGVLEWVVRRYTMTQMYEASGSLGPLTSAQLPQAGAFLARRNWRCNNTDATAVVLVANSTYEERY